MIVYSSYSNLPMREITAANATDHFLHEVAIALRSACFSHASSIAIAHAWCALSVYRRVRGNIRMPLNRGWALDTYSDGPWAPRNICAPFMQSRG